MIESHVAKYDIKRIIKKTIINTTDQESDKVRSRPLADYLWKSLYECHHAGSKRHAKKTALQKEVNISQAGLRM